MFLRISGTQSSIQPEAVFQPFGWPISGTCLLSWLIIGLLITLILATRHLKLRPNRQQTLLEMIYGLIFGLIAQLIGSDQKAKRVFPLFGSLFVFILISNYIAYIPGISSLSWNGQALFRTPTNDFNTTFGLALLSLFYIQWSSIRQFGLFSHIGKYIKLAGIWRGFRQSLSAGLMGIMEFAIGLMDIVSECARAVSLSLRLFGNVFAGEVLTIIIMGAFAWLLPSTWMAMGLLSGLVQAVVFTSLVSVYYTLAVSE